MGYLGTAALVTGASSGIGAAFAQALAERSMDLLLTALPAERADLDGLAQELAARHRVRVEVVALDLAARDGACRLQAAADELGFEPDMLVNCAGIGAVGAFSQLSLERQLSMIHINVVALVALTGLYLPRFIAKGHGAVINVASTAAMAPIPYFAVYGASKAFVLSLSEALWAECRRYGVRVVATCPGPVATQFHARAQSAAPRFQLTTQAVVSAALDALDRDRPTVVQRVPGFGLLFAAIAAPIVPRRFRLLAGELIARWFFQQS